MSRKRLFDLVLLLPLLPFILLLIGGLGLLVLVFDGRPIFFTQRRLGKGKRPFRILKLRTMSTEAEVQARRPTRFGQWLRQRGLDELPQLLNVLVGDMSLVGPRPLEEKDATRLTAMHGEFVQRFEATPGLTGLSQVCQAKGAGLTAQLDAWYAQHSGPMLDLQILLRTALMNVVGKRRATLTIRPEFMALSPATTTRQHQA